MLNIIELEARWLRYKIKSYIPYLVIFFSLTIIIISSIIFFDTEKVEKTEIISQNKLLLEDKSSDEELKVSKEIKIDTPIFKEVTIVKPEINKSQTRTLVPSMDFMKEMQNSSQPYYETQDEISQPYNSSTDNSNPLQEKDIVEEVIEEITLANTIETVENKDVEEDEIQKISIKRKNTESDIHGIILRFKKNNNPALSLFIAKKYYELGDYHNSYNYALITNELNEEIEASWIIFSKSLVKLNKKNQAIKTLKDYTEHSGSNSARILLDEIISGKFK